MKSTLTIECPNEHAAERAQWLGRVALQDTVTYNNIDASKISEVLLASFEYLQTSGYFKTLKSNAVDVRAWENLLGEIREDFSDTPWLKR